MIRFFVSDGTGQVVMNRAPGTPSGSTLAGRGRGGPGHLHVVPAALIVMLVLAWFVTCGDWRFAERDQFGSYYDAQAQSLLHGRLDVPADSVGSEAFVRGGKFYGYFGIAPSLVRLPLNQLFPQMYGRWTRLSLLTAASLNLLFAYRLLSIFSAPRGDGQTMSAYRRALDNLFVLCAGLGSSNVFIMSRAYVFHEAIAWASTLSVIFCYYFLRYLRDADTRAFFLASTAGLLALLSRATTGGGCFLAMTLLCMGLLISLALQSSGRRWPGPAFLAAASHRRVRRDALLAVAAVAVSLTLYAAVNYCKFQTLDGAPVRYYVQYHREPWRMRATGGRQLHLSNLRAGLYDYFSPRGLAFHASFPWFYMTLEAVKFPGTIVDVLEPYCSLPLSAPALCFLALLGGIGMIAGKPVEVRRARLPALAMLAGGGIVLLSVGLTERYVHDFYPVLILAGAAGIGKLTYTQTRTRRLMSLTVLVALSFFSVAVNMAFALEFQRERVEGVSEAKRDEFRSWRARVDAVVLGEKRESQQ